MTKRENKILVTIYNEPYRDDLLHVIAEKKLRQKLQRSGALKGLSDEQVALKINVEIIKADHDFPLSMKTAIARSLSEKTEDEIKIGLPPEETLMRGQLAVRLMKGEDFSLSKDERIMIKERVLKTWGISIFTQVQAWLYPNGEKEE